MKKRAFVIGANCNKLEYAESDAQKIAHALINLGYEVADLPATEEKSHELVQRFKEFANQSKSHDTLLFYFSGHGKVIKTQLFLALNSSSLNDLPSSGIDISSITTTLNVCNASNKLLILDCCESEQDTINTISSDNYQILSAAEKWQQAIEFTELQAGFLSYHIHQLLTSPPCYILNNQHELTINALVKQLQHQVIEHNRNKPHQSVPKFIIFGKQTHDFSIAQIKTPYYAGLLAITPQFIEQEGNKHLSNSQYSFEQFYGANPLVQWWGVVNDLVAPRAIYNEIKNHIETILQKTTNKPIIALILGSGGMGKSTLLRQLAIDLSKSHEVFWLDNWEEFHAERIADSLTASIICLDNWHRLANEDKKSIKKWLERNSNLHHKIKWLITDREEAKELSEFIYGNKSFFDFDDIQNVDKAQDNELLLEKVAEKMPSWKQIALDLKNHAIAKAKPFQILFVLYRWAGQEEKIDFENFETSFYKIIKDDISQLQKDKIMVGFANALIDFSAIFSRFNVRLTQATFLRLADHYRGGDYLFSCYKETSIDGDAWGVLRYYLSVFGVTKKLRGSEGIFLKFIKDDLAEAVDNIFNKEFNQRKSLVCTFVIDDTNRFSASEMLHASIINNIFNAKTILIFIRNLLDKKNSVDCYLRPIFDPTFTINISNDNREELLEKLVAINPNSGIIHSYLNFLGKTEAGQQKAIDLLSITQSKSIICKCLKTLTKTEASQQKALEILSKTHDEKVICLCLNILDKTEIGRQKSIELLDKYRNKKIIYKCFDILGKTSVTRQKSLQLLAQNNQSKGIILRCFDILGKTDETKQKAIELLAQSQNTLIICKCLDILGNEAKDKVIELLAQDNQDKAIISKCFDVLGKTEETKQKAIELLMRDNQDESIICKCFAILGRTEYTKKYARQFMLDYPCNENILAWCVNILGEEAILFSLERLKNWELQNAEFNKLFQNCLYVCRNEEQIKDIVDTIIKQKDEWKYHYINVLKIPLSHIKSWQQENTDILNDWIKYKRVVVGASLIGNHNDLTKVKNTCQQILINWEREISFQKEIKSKVYHFHIFKALAYPSADDKNYRDLVQTTAKAMLIKETQAAGFLGNMLYEAAFNIIHHQQYPAWIPEEENE